jgi:hypothetical protein
MESDEHCCQPAADGKASDGEALALAETEKARDALRQKEKADAEKKALRFLWASVPQQV